MRAPETSRSRRFHRSPGTSRNDRDSADFDSISMSPTQRPSRASGARWR